METVPVCPICGYNAFKTHLICKDYLVSEQSFSIQSCENCNFRLTNPRPGANSIGAYYKSDQYISHNDQSSNLIGTAYRFVRSYTLNSKLNLIKSLNRGVGKILDVGCGTGAFLEKCKIGGWQIMGTEPDKDARDIATKKLDINIQPDFNVLTADKSFNIITLWHVIEHIPDLNEVISKFHQHLDNKGTVLIAVPNSDSYDAKYFKQYWAAYDVPRHLYHFTPLTIESLFKNHGFKLIDKRPMMFDAFYISLLSTRYETGKTDYLKSLRIGITSNTKAKRTGNYSSLIYLFSKA